LSRGFVARGVDEGTLYVAELGGEIVATLTLQWSDEPFWGRQPDDAGYVHRLVVRRDRTGTGLGSELLDWAAGHVRGANRAWLRLDVSPDNLPLRSYYERHGFEYRGDVEGQYEKSDGAIVQWRSRRYERAVSEEPRV
jgi:ribosomal protein S18 acetylase RimI-like enzyme